MDLDQESLSASRFRISAFPGSRFKEPEVAVAHVTDVEGPWIRFRYTEETTALDRDAVFFDVQDCDPAEPSSLINLAEQLHGDVVPLFRLRWRDAYRDAQAEYRGQMLEVYAGEMSRLAGLMGYPPFEADEFHYQRERGVDFVSLPQKVHVAEIAARVWMIQGLTLAAKGKIPLQESGFTNTFPAIPPHLTWDEFRARSWLLLGAVSPHLDCGPTGEPEMRLASRVTALEVCALQLYNAVVSDTGLKECMACHRVFHRQRGRAKFEESSGRSDAMYCTFTCAKQASQRRWRARKKAEKEGVQHDEEG